MAAAAPVRVPLAQEGECYWENLVSECQRQTAAINSLVSGRGFPPDQLIEWDHAGELHLRRPLPPSTNIHVMIHFQSWGPVISGRITGHQTPLRAFYLEEVELPIARDLDGSVIAVFDQGRSFSPRELATYLMQSFRRCYPGLSLPCESPFR